MASRLSGVSLLAALCLAAVRVPLYSEPAMESAGEMVTDVKRINEFLESAFDAYVNEDYEAASLNFERVLQLNPKDKIALKGRKQTEKMLKLKKDSIQNTEKDRLSRARKYIKKDRWLDAMDQLSSVLTASPNNFEAQKMQNELSATFREKMTDSKALPADDVIYQGMIHYLNKHYEEAIKFWREAARQRPEDFKIVVLVERGEQVLRQNEKYEVLVVGRQRAKAYFASGNYADAAKMWRRVLDLQPEDKEARENFEKANLEASKTNRESRIGDHYDKGLDFFNHGQFAESLGEWKNILDLDPNNEVAKDYIERIRQKGIKIDAPAPEVKVSSPTAPAEIKTPAVQPAEGVTNEQKEQAQKHYTQGSIKYAEGNLDEAMKEWREAIRIYPGHGPTLKVLNKISNGGKK